MFPMFYRVPHVVPIKVSLLNIELERNKEGANLQGASPKPNMCKEPNLCKVRIII
jgi:hypothetical protein